MGLLGPFGTPVLIGRLGEMVGPVSVVDELPHRFQGLAGDPGGVGPHIGDEAHRPFVPQVDAFIEPLGQGHGFLGSKPELAVGLHLQAAGDERRRGIALLRLLVDLGHPEFGGFQVVQDLFHLPGVIGLDGLGAMFQQVGQEPRRFFAGQAGVQGPVLIGHEGLDGPLPVAHQAQGYGLHPAGAEPRLDFLPEQGADLIAHQPVQDAARLLGLEAGPIQRHRVGQGFPDGLLGQLQEQDPVKLMVLLPQGLGDVPGDGLPFPVRVGGQVDLGDARRHFLQLLDDLGLTQDGDVFGLKVVLQVDPELMGRQVPDMAFAGEDHKLVPQVFLQGLGLGG